MPDTTIDTILERWRADMASADHSRTKAAGDAFERLCIAFLARDPVQRLQYRNVRHFADWSRFAASGEAIAEEPPVLRPHAA